MRNLVKWSFKAKLVVFTLKSAFSTDVGYPRLLLWPLLMLLILFNKKTKRNYVNCASVEKVAQTTLGCPSVSALPSRSRAVKPPPIISPGLGGSYKYGPGQPKDTSVNRLQSNVSTVHFASARFTLKTIMKVVQRNLNRFSPFFKFKHICCNFCDQVFAFVFLVLAVAMVSAKPAPQDSESIYSVKSRGFNFSNMKWIFYFELVNSAILAVINSAVPNVQPGSFNRPPAGGVSSFASAQQNTGPSGQTFFAAQTGVAQGSSRP